MKIAAFDLGSTWAFATEHGAGHCDLNPGRGKPKLARKRPEILGRFEHELTLLGATLPGFDLIVHSQPFARGQAATRLLWGMAGILEAAAHNAGCAVLDATDSQIKKWATGSGKADKDMMLVAARELGYTGDNEHEADAWCLLRYAEETFTKEP